MLTQGNEIEAVVVEKHAPRKIRHVHYEFVDILGANYSGETTGSYGFYEDIEVGDSVKILYDPYNPFNNERADVVWREANLPELDIGLVLGGMCLGSVIGFIGFGLLSKKEEKVEEQTILEEMSEEDKAGNAVSQAELGAAARAGLIVGGIIGATVGLIVYGITYAVFYFGTLPNDTFALIKNYWEYFPGAGSIICGIGLAFYLTNAVQKGKPL
jgi:hypothetical protein